MCVQCTSVDPRAMCVAQVARRAMGDGVRTRGDGIVSVQHGRSTLHPRRQPQPLGMGYHPHLSGQRGEGQAAVADERPRCRPLLLPAGLGDQALWTVHCRAAGAPSQGVVTAGGRHIHIYIYIYVAYCCQVSSRVPAADVWVGDRRRRDECSGPSPVLVTGHHSSTVRSATADLPLVTARNSLWIHSVIYLARLATDKNRKL